jgi:hypothetical protein
MAGYCYELSETLRMLLPLVLLMCVYIRASTAEILYTKKVNRTTYYYFNISQTVLSLPVP